MLRKPHGVGDWAAVAGFLILVGAFGYVFLTTSYHPAPRAEEQYRGIQRKTNNGQQKAQSYSAGAQAAPLVVQLQRTPTSEAEAEQDAEYRERKAADDRVVWWAGFAVLVGALQAVALFLALLTSALVAVRQLRAYMYGEIVGVATFSPPTNIRVLVEWKNAGPTPAKNFETHGSVFVGQIPLPDDIDFEPGEPKEPVDVGRHGKPAVYPGTISKSDLVLPPGEQISSIDIAQLKNGERVLYAVSGAFYRDVFGRKRITRFCRYIDPVCMRQFLEALEGHGLGPPQIVWTAAHVLNDFT